MIRIARLLSLLLVATPVVAAGQQVISPRPGQGEINLPPHIREQLWPKRQLSPVEQELRNHIVTMMDTLGVLRSTNAQIARHTGSNASPAMLRSVSRSLVRDCARASRTSVPVAEFGATLSTNNAKWGDTAINNWRTALATFRTEMDRCERDALQQVESPDKDRLARLAQQADAAVVTYQRAESGLLNTLKIEIDPRRNHRGA
mgnify:CR=1 FL=1